MKKVKNLCKNSFYFLKNHTSTHTKNCVCMSIKNKNKAIFLLQFIKEWQLLPIQTC